MKWSGAPAAPCTGLRRVPAVDPRLLRFPRARRSYFSCVVRNWIVQLSLRERLVGPEFRAEAALATVGELSGGVAGQVSAGDPSTVPEAARVWAPLSEGVRLLPAIETFTTGPRTARVHVSDFTNETKIRNVVRVQHTTTNEIL